jgi:hypothetical protein
MTATKRMRKMRKNRSVKKGGLFGLFESKVEPNTDDDTDTKCMLFKDYLDLLVKEQKAQEESNQSSEEKKEYKFTYPYFQSPLKIDDKTSKYKTFSICQAHEISISKPKGYITETEYKLIFTHMNQPNQKIITYTNNKFNQYNQLIYIYRDQPDIQDEQKKVCNVSSGGNTKRRRRMRRKHTRKNSIRK